MKDKIKRKIQEAYALGFADGYNACKQKEEAVKKEKKSSSSDHLVHTVPGKPWLAIFQYD